MSSKVFAKIYRLVKTIPSGQVTTYGALARKLQLSPRTIGWALHANRDPSVPCHRVVNRFGDLAQNYAFGGWQEQKRRLHSEGVALLPSSHRHCRGTQVAHFRPLEFDLTTIDR